MAGVEQDNFNNEEFIEEAARYAFTTVTVSKDFKDKNKKASYGGVGQIPQQKNCVYIFAICY